MYDDWIVFYNKMKIEYSILNIEQLTRLFIILMYFMKNIEYAEILVSSNGNSNILNIEGRFLVPPTVFQNQR